MNQRQHAVCLLIPNGLNALAISRRDDNTRWGLPGGKVDLGESNLDAIRREVAEEIGLTFEPAAFEPIYSALCAGEQTFWVTTYLLKGPTPSLQDMKPEAGLLLDWMSMADLSDVITRKSPFAHYNRGVVRAYNEYADIGLARLAKIIFSD